jgi:hypothetical protein
MGVVTVSKCALDKKIISFPHDLQPVSKIKAIEIYTHVSSKDFIKIRNPLDQIIHYS